MSKCEYKFFVVNVKFRCFFVSQYQSNCKLQVYYMSPKQNLINSNVNICFILTPFLILPSQPLLPPPLKLQNFTTQNGSLICVCADLASLSHT